jgi:hypothetical protein
MGGEGRAEQRRQGGEKGGNNRSRCRLKKDGAGRDLAGPKQRGAALFVALGRYGALPTVHRSLDLSLWATPNAAPFIFLFQY